MAVEQSLVIIKPDGIVKRLEGDVLSKLSSTGLEIIGAKISKVTKELAHEHYNHLKEKPFYQELIKYITGDIHKVHNLFALVYQGQDAVKKIRDVCGATNPEDAHPTSIRGRYGRVTTKGVMENIVHASENAKEAEREIKLWFKPEEIISNIYKTKRSNKNIEVEEWD